MTNAYLALADAVGSVGSGLRSLYVPTHFRDWVPPACFSVRGPDDADEPAPLPIPVGTASGATPALDALGRASTLAASRPRVARSKPGGIAATRILAYLTDLAVSDPGRGADMATITARCYVAMGTAQHLLNQRGQLGFIQRRRLLTSTGYRHEYRAVQDVPWPPVPDGCRTGCREVAL